MKDLNAYLDGGPLRGQTFEIPEMAYDYFQAVTVDEANTGWIAKHNSPVAIPEREALHVYWRNGESRDGMRVYQHVRTTKIRRDELGKVVEGVTIMANGVAAPLNRDDLKALGETILSIPRQ